MKKQIKKYSPINDLRKSESPHESNLCENTNNIDKNVNKMDKQSEKSLNESTFEKQDALKGVQIQDTIKNKVMQIHNTLPSVKMEKSLEPQENLEQPIYKNKNGYISSAYTNFKRNASSNKHFNKGFPYNSGQYQSYNYNAFDNEDDEDDDQDDDDDDNNVNFSKKRVPIYKKNQQNNKKLKW